MSTFPRMSIPTLGRSSLFWMLKRRVAVRYLLVKGKEIDAYEHFHVEVLYLSPSPLRPYEFLHFSHSVSYGGTLNDRSRLWVTPTFGTQLDAGKAVANILKRWSDQAEKFSPVRAWLRNEPFVGVVSLDKRTLEFPASSQLFEFHNGLMLARMREYSEHLQHAISFERSIRPLADAAERAVEHFSAFAARTHHEAVGMALAA